MIVLLFNTKTHMLEIKSLDLVWDEKTYSNVTTIIDFVSFYEVRQRQDSTDKSIPIFRFPVSQTIIKYIHE